MKTQSTHPIRPLFRVIALCAGLFFSLACGSPALFAQQTATAVIEGRVKNSFTNAYLNNARVRVAGTSAEIFTNSFGEYRITVPAVSADGSGAVTLEAFYTGLPTWRGEVAVVAGQTVTHDINLAIAPADEVVRMDKYVVESRRDTNAAAIAINEQRFAASMRNVVSTDAYGDVAQGNIGEFLKNLPGVTVEYSGNSAQGVQVRGFNSNFTAVTLDGGSLASAANTSTQNHSRSFGLDQASINNLSRIEVVKLPTPDMAANLLGGAVNLISKSAFERDSAELLFSAYITMNQDEMNPFSRSAGPGSGDSFKALPSAELTWVVPLRKNLGIVFTASSVSQYYRTVKTLPNRNWLANGATPANPQTPSFNGSEAKNKVERDSVGIKADWKPWPRHVLSLSLQANATLTENLAQGFNANGGAPASATSWGETFFKGIAGRGAVTESIDAREKHGLAQAAIVNYAFNGDDWTIEATANTSFSRTITRDADKGFFQSIVPALQNVSRVDLLDIDNNKGAAGHINAYDATSNPLDITSLASYKLDTVLSNPSYAKDTVTEARFSVARRFNKIPVFDTFQLKAGGAYNKLKRNIEYTYNQYTYAGPKDLTPFIDKNAGTKSVGDGYPVMQWISPWLVYNAFEQHPEWFTQTAKQQGDSIKNNAVRSPTMEEAVSAAYLMADAKLFNNRVRLVGGVRYEYTDDKGQGYLQDANNLYERNPDGTFKLDADGKRILKPETAGNTNGQTPGSAHLMYQKRAAYNARDYDGFYPSAHATINITDNLIFRAAFAKTIGRPPISDIVPNFYVGKNDGYDPSAPGSAIGWITAANSTLKPWTAKNYDFSLEYYFPNGGVASVGVFRKDIRDFFGTYTQIADSALLDKLGLSEEYVGYTYSTRINAGNARIDGLELNWSQSLGFLGGWGNPFYIFANYTKLDLNGNQMANFKDFKPMSANVGVNIKYGRFGLMAKWNYQDKQRREYTDSKFVGSAEYIRARSTIDVSANYQITKRLALFATARNITNEHYTWEVIGPAAPAWSRLTSDEYYGAQFTFGVRGTF